MSRSAEGTYRRCEDGRLIVRFAAGEESAAREFLGRRPQGDDLHHGAVERWISGWRMTLLVSVLVGFVGLAVTLFAYFAADVEAGWLLLGSVALVPVSFVLFMLLFGIGELVEGSFVVSREHAYIRWKRRVVPFEQMGLPKRARVSSTGHGDGEAVVVSEVVEIPVTSGDALKITENKHSPEQLADTINEILAQYHERRAIRQWLAQREAERSAKTGPYRDDGTALERGASRPS